MAPVIDGDWPSTKPCESRTETIRNVVDTRQITLARLGVESVIPDFATSMMLSRIGETLEVLSDVLEVFQPVAFGGCAIYCLVGRGFVYTKLSWADADDVAVFMVKVVDHSVGLEIGGLEVLDFPKDAYSSPEWTCVRAERVEECSVEKDGADQGGGITKVGY